MDAVPMIVEALAAGAAAGAKDTATQVVKDTYSSLRRLVQGHLAGRPAAEVALEQQAQRPEEATQVLEAELVETGVGTDARAIEVAEQLLALLDPEGSRSGKYVVDVRGAQGVQVGDRNTQHISFGGGGPSA